MGKKLLITLIFILSFSAFSYETFIISDLDDTIKRTNVDHSGRAIYNGAFTRNIFSGMDDLFQMMSGYSSDLYVLSNSPNMLRYNIIALLKKYEISVTEISTRNLIRDRNGFNYKFNYVVEKITNTNQKAILIGDDVGEDPEVYAKVKQQYPSKVAAIYIHKVKNRVIPQGLTPYISVFDIAVREYAANRMNLAQAFVLGDNLLRKYDPNKVIPHFSFCPKKKSFWTSHNVSELNDLVEDIANKMTKFCQMRKQ